ncbi:MAG TPA: N,N-dimethylformamidase beta subunit family domain-containing protein [Candidatus Sulfotelmatobacter sp.]|nr:N,N-dimethylformamidase beta subunit family domain-containing protein [Candidatus Sulfotelmatobacter sp.]
MKGLNRLLLWLAGVTVFVSLSVSAFASCSAPANPIEAENCQPGNPSSQWDVDGAGDLTIQGFATNISVNVGQVINFKIDTNATAYTIEIYRMGYYGGDGARLITTIQPSVKLPQTQPACLTDSTTGLVDCGNWAISASWQVPSNATSGIYFAHLVRSDTGGDSHIVFVVRNDASTSSILFQTADESWEAYNGYDGGSLYGPSDVFDLTQRAYKVSYNRPFITRGFAAESATWVFGAEYPMVRWLERNGYDVSYFTGVDAARNGNLILNHKLYLSVGHDEYWSGPHRANVEAARAAGVNVAFFSGNEVFWKTRWENSIDGTNTPYRTLVCYKETLGPNSNPPAVAAVDPLDPPTWTGTWRDNSKSPPDDGGRPENALTGTIFMVNGPDTDNPGNLTIQVPQADGQMRFWRNTTEAKLSAGQTATLPKGTLGYEWDEDLDNGARPAGDFDLSTVTYTLTTDLLLDQGGTYGAGAATHHLTLHRYYNNVGESTQTPLGLVFGAGTVQWSWGLDNTHDNPFNYTNPAADPDMQQATVNLFADMGVQPATLQSGLVAATASTDTTAPTSEITWPTGGTALTSNSTVSITGTATDSGGGVVGGVEISLDGGNTWHPATGRGSWTYSWTPTSLGSFMLESRATDDSGNLEIPSANTPVVTVNPPDCPCSDWSSSTTPTQADSGDPSAGEYGVRFRSDYNGYITGIRFYKASTNTGTHIGNLWTNSGTLLATATFTNETSAGWQQVTFSNPVAITADTTYVASYFTPSGHYSDTAGYFATSGADAPPLHFLENGVDGANGIYVYSSTSTFPTSTFGSTNYWVDVVFVPASSMPGAPPALLLQPGNLSFAAFVGNGNPPSQSVTVYNEGSGTLNWAASSNAAWLTATPSSGSTPTTVSISVNAAGLSAGTYTGTITVSASGTNNPPQTISVTLTVTNLLLFSNFSDGTMNGWAFSPLGFASNWSVSNGLLQYNGGGHTQVYAGDSAWTNYNLNVAIKLSTLNDYPGGIRGRLNPSTGAGYAVWLYPAQGLIKLFKNTAWDIDTGLTTLAQASVPFDAINFHNVQLSFQGSQISVLYDGRAVITVTDSTYGSGLIALDVSNQVINFTNVLVTSGTANTGSLTAAPSSLSFSALYDGSSPAPQNLQLSNAASGSLVWTATSSASWLIVTPAYANTSSTAQVSVTPTGLNPGTYNGKVTIVALGSIQTTTTIPVTLTIATPPPILSVSPSSTLNFISVAGQNTPSQTVSIANGSPIGSFNWTASTSATWLGASPTSGPTPQNVAVSVSPAGLANGSYSANLTVTAGGVNNSPQTVPVTLQVLSQDMTETFADLGTGWVVSPLGQGNGWSVSNGVYSYSGLGLSQSCTGNSAWTDYTLDANVQLSNLSDWPGGLRGRVNPSTGAGYLLWLYPALNEVILYNASQWSVNGPLTQLASAPLTLDTNVHDLRMDFRGSVITIYWDGATLMSATDSSYANGIVCLDADNQPIAYSNIKVAAVQNQLALDPITPSSLTFNAQPGGTAAPQTINITAAGAKTTWAVSTTTSWIGLSVSGSLTPGTLTISINTSGLAQGTYTGSVLLSAPGASNSPISIPVTLAIKSAVLSVTPSSTMTFFGAVGLNPNPQTIQVANLGTGVLNWTETNTNSWLGVSPTSGAAPSTITVSPSTATTGTGSFSDTIVIGSNNVANGPINVPVSMQVGSLLFSDNFSTTPDGNWTVGPLGFASGWSIVNGAYTYNGGGHTQSYAGSSAWTDYTVSTDFQLASLNDYPGGLRGRLNTTSGASYGVWVYPAEKVLKLFRIGQWNIDAQNSLLGQSSTINIDTNWHNLRLVFQGTTIQVYYDNVLQITATDSTYSQGAIALDVSNQPISFDNVTVISLP